MSSSSSSSLSFPKPNEGTKRERRRGNNGTDASSPSPNVNSPSPLANIPPSTPTFDIFSLGSSSPTSPPPSSHTSPLPSRSLSSASSEPKSSMPPSSTGVSSSNFLDPFAMPSFSNSNSSSSSSSPPPATQQFDPFDMFTQQYENQQKPQQTQPTQQKAPQHPQQPIVTFPFPANGNTKAKEGDEEDEESEEEESEEEDEDDHEEEDDDDEEEEGKPTKAFSSVASSPQIGLALTSSSAKAVSASSLSTSSSSLSTASASATFSSLSISGSSTSSSPSSSVGMSTVPVDVLSFMKKGTSFLKYGKYGFPHFRQFQLSDDNSKIVWFSSAKKLNDSQVDFFDIEELVLGQVTATFARHPAPELSKSSFSVIYQRNKTLDLIAKDPNEYRVWVAGLRALIQLAKEGNHHDLQSLQRLVIDIPVAMNRRTSMELVNNANGNNGNGNGTGASSIDEKSQSTSSPNRRGSDMGNKALQKDVVKNFQELKRKHKKRKTQLLDAVFYTHKTYESMKNLIKKVEESIVKVEEWYQDGDFGSCDDEIWRASVDMESLKNMMHAVKG